MRRFVVKPSPQIHLASALVLEDILGAHLRRPAPPPPGAPAASQDLPGAENHRMKQPETEHPGGGSTIVRCSEFGKLGRQWVSVGNWDE
ncbi:MAG: hypothetical protein JXB15_09590 [Anaerolineales bacterium]|nr:hypothetical protein [Anaerolineales bacterium]